MSHTDVIELRDLRALLAVVRSGSFTAAAAELGYTQSAVSQQIGALEAELGQRLLERRPVRPTAAGARLAEHAARVLLRLDVARSELAHLHRGPGEISVDACPLAAPDLLSAALRELRRAHPGLRAVVRSTDAETAVRHVATGGADVALVDAITAPDNPLALSDAGLLSSTALVEVPLVVALPAGHPLSGRRSLDLEMLSEAPWVSVPPLPGSRAVVLARVGAVDYRGGDLPTLLSLIAGGHGCALIPAPVRPSPPEVAVVPLGRPALVHRTEALALRNAPDLPQRLIAALREHGSLS